MSPTIVRRAVAAASVLVLFACRSESTTGPDVVGRVFFLEQANAAPLPLLVLASPSDRRSLLAENLTFDSFSTLTLVTTIRIDKPLTGSSTTTANRVTRQYRITGDSIEIGSFTPCPPNSGCVANDKGTITDGNIYLSSFRFSNRLSLIFRRIE